MEDLNERNKTLWRKTAANWFSGGCEFIQGPLPKIPKIISSISPFSFFVSTVQKSRCKMPKNAETISIQKKAKLLENKAGLKKSAVIKKSKLLGILQQEWKVEVCYMGQNFPLGGSCLDTWTIFPMIQFLTRLIFNLKLCSRSANN